MKDVYGNELCPADCLADAVRVMQQYHQLDVRAVVECYPRHAGFANGGGGVCHYQFFDKTGLNVGHYTPDMNSVLSFANGREYPGWQTKVIERIDLWMNVAT